MDDAGSESAGWENSQSPSEKVEDHRKAIAAYEAIRAAAKKHDNQLEVDRCTHIIDEHRHGITETKSVAQRRQMFTKHIERLDGDINKLEEYFDNKKQECQKTLAAKSEKNT